MVFLRPMIIIVCSSHLRKICFSGCRHAKSHALSVILTPGVSVSRSSFNNSHTSYHSSNYAVRGFGMASTGNLCGVWFKLGTSVLKNGEENEAKEERNGECLRHRR